jgi:hypothetical protein
LHAKSYNIATQAAKPRLVKKLRAHSITKLATCTAELELHGKRGEVLPWP